MNEVSFQDSFPGRLAEYLTELGSRLRLFPSPDSGRLIPPPTLIRLRTAARLLAHREEQSGNSCFGDLNRALAGFIDFVEENPEKYRGDLDAPLEALAEHLEQQMAAVDAGNPMASAAADPRWELVLSRFQSAGTALAVIPEMTRVLDRWEEAAWSDRIRPAETEALHRSWLEVRRRGDQLFEKPILESPSGKTNPVTVQGREVLCALLVDSPFQRDQLLQAIRDGGSRAVVLTGPEQLADLIEEGAEGLVLLGDNLEPSRNLERIITGFSTGNPQIAARCVLVSGAGSGRDDLQRRATALGADGVWCPPFDLEALRGILDNRSL